MSLSPQPTFGGLFDNQPSRRLFFGIWPDSDALESLRQLMAQLRRDGVMLGKPVDAGRLHLTLHHLGDFADQIPPSLLPTAQEAATTVRAQPFDVVFDRICGTRRGQFLLWSSDKLAALRDFRQALSNALVKAGLRRHIATTFSPHVTLSYEACDFSDVPETSIPPIRWSVRDFVLIESLLGQHKHIRRGVWPL